MLDGQIIMLKNGYYAGEYVQCMSHLNSHEQTRAQCFTFLLGARSFSSKDRASLGVLLAVVSVVIVSSSAPPALEVKGLQEAVELDSEVELLELEHATIVQLVAPTFKSHEIC